MASPVPLLRLEGIGRTFDCSLVVALQDIDLAIHSGEVIAVVGQSGSGKTSLINIMGGCESPTSGRVYCAAMPMRRGTGTARGMCSQSAATTADISEKAASA